MPSHFLYAQPIPQSAQTRATETYEQRLALQSALDAESNVKVLGSKPSTKQIRVQYRGLEADRMARQLNDLFDTGNFGAVAYYGVDDTGQHVQTPEDGYYALESTDSGFPDPRLRNLPYATGRLRPVGTRKSHFRRVDTAPYTPENGNPFGNGTSEEVGVPPSATRVRWWTRDPNELSSASPSSSRTTAWGDVDIYDATDAPYEDPALVFVLPYEAEGKFDPVVWDDHDAGKFRSVDGEQVRNWEHVYKPGHEPQGNHVVSNGKVRYFFDEDTPEVVVQQWDAASSVWSARATGSSSWHFYDEDLRENGQQRVWGYTWWTDGATEYPLRFTLPKGYHYAQFHVPTFEPDPVPTGLVDLLDPVASGQSPLTGADKTVVERTEVTPS